MKMKVGADLDDDVRRAALIREEIGSERFLMMDANQVWESSAMPPPAVSPSRPDTSHRFVAREPPPPGSHRRACQNR